MAVKRLVSLGRLSALPDGRPKLVVGPDGRRDACVRRGERAVVLDDRCPHEGHPLSMGILSGETLTCQWHNWKFDLESGACAFGGESVRRYPSEVHGDELFVDHETDERARHHDDLVRALRDGNINAAVRVSLRWSRDEALAAIAHEVAACAPHGLRDAVPAIGAARALAERGVVDEAESIAIACSVAAQEMNGRSRQKVPIAIASTLEDGADFLAALVDERRDHAVARVRGLDADLATTSLRWFGPFLAAKLWDLGGACARIAASLAFPSDAMAIAATRALAWATADSDLPPFRATRRALGVASGIAPANGDVELVDALLGEHAIDATLAALRTASPDAVLRGIARASIVRLARYDVRWSSRANGTATALDALAPLLLARAARAFSPAHRVAFAVQGAALLDRVRRRDGERTAATRDAREVVRDAIIGRAPDPDLARRTVAAAALLQHAEESPQDERIAHEALEVAFVHEPPASLARLAAVAARHVATGEPPDDATS